MSLLRNLAFYVTVHYIYTVNVYKRTTLVLLPNRQFCFQDTPLTLSVSGILDSLNGPTRRPIVGSTHITGFIRDVGTTTLMSVKGFWICGTTPPQCGI